MIEFKNIHKQFGKLKVLEGLNLDIRGGGIFAILGPNGSGKTTLIKCLLGMVIPNKGEIVFQNEIINGQWAYRNNLSYLPQIANFPPNISVREMISMVKNLRPKNADSSTLIERFGLCEFMSQKLGNLSGGTKQKVNIVLTFMFDSDVIILDEPTTGLDPIALIYLKELIEEERKKGKTILITTHIMSVVEELADEIIFLLEGNIYFKGTIAELKEKTDDQNLEHAIAHLISKQYA